MESPRKEDPDSRASEAGRKRAFQEPPPDSGEVITIDSSSDEDSEMQPQQKRVKYDHDDQSVSDSSRATNISEKTTNETLVAADSVQAPAISWNQGVQSGLRTSFGSKIKKISITTNTEKSVPGGIDDGKQPNQTKTAAETAETLTRTQRMPKGAKMKARKGKIGIEMGQLETETENAAIALEKFGVPLPPHCQLIADKIAGGLTLYPKRLESTPSYINKTGEFRLEETFHDGKPVSIKDLTMRDFAVAFLQGNRDKIEDIKPKQLGAAFNIYVLKYYNHIHPTFRESITSTQNFHANKLLTVLRQAKGQLKESKKHRTSKEPIGSDTTLKSNERQTNIMEESSGTDAKNADTRHMSEGENSSSMPTENMPTPSGNISPQVTAPESAFVDQGIQQAPITVVDDEVFTIDATPAKVDISERNDTASLVGESAAIGYDDAENDILQRYFPAAGSSSNTPRCLSCAGHDHSTVDCDAFTCAACDTKGDHTTISCPQNQRCGKCRQRGHGIAECPEKLRVPKDEMPGCDICNSAGHVEADCSFIWRSFRTRPEETKKVNSMHIYCYCCGNSGHYGGECGLRHGPVPSGFTWLKSNLAPYLDPSSANQVLAAGVNYSISERSRNGFSVKGKGGRPKKRQPQTIVINDSDDDRGSFIRPKVNNPPPRMGGIRIVEPSRPQSMGQSNISHRGPPDTYHPREDSARYGRETTFTAPPRYNEQYNYQPRAMDTNYNLRSHQGQPTYSNGWSAQEYPQRNPDPLPPPNTARDDEAPIRGKNYRVGKRTRRRKERELMVSRGH
ncbi:hypothetical protein F5884DRAFT_673096 [Xylogone sp. PMI_703]|nr:hypothetical protein F5884DRAFT_673096 [Xylogone sp. PMI_703]